MQGGVVFSRAPFPGGLCYLDMAVPIHFVLFEVLTKDKIRRSIFR